MIYLITGVPGSGKTLYAVSNLIQKLAAEKITGKDGVEKTRRVVIDGIKDLLLPHDLMAPGEEKDGSLLPSDDGDGLWNWFDWCQPGDVLVVDEVQRWWRPRGMNQKPPQMISALETHRHKGVDFVIITQNPMLIDQNVRRLIGRHQHVRRLFGMKRAAIYDWDGCSVDVNRTKTATTSMWSYPKSAYALYKSSELHTKQRQKIPPWLIIPVLAIVGGLFVMPKAFSTMQGTMTGKGFTGPAPASSAPASPAPALPPLLPASGVPPAPSSAASSPATTVIEQKTEFAGCFAVAKKCACLDVKGLTVTVENSVCQSHILGNSEPGQKTTVTEFFHDVPDISDQRAKFEKNAGDAEVLAFMAKARKSN